MTQTDSDRSMHPSPMWLWAWQGFSRPPWAAEPRKSCRNVRWFLCGEKKDPAAAAGKSRSGLTLDRETVLCVSGQVRKACMLRSLLEVRRRPKYT